MDAEKKRMLKSEYRNMLRVGAVYALECSGNHRRWIRWTPDIQGMKNRFQFSVSMKQCPDPATRLECDKYGWESISLVVLEELKMKKDQTSKEFSDELKLLCKMWTEKQADDDKG